jgi:hypothetical protein
MGKNLLKQRASFKTRSMRTFLNQTENDQISSQVIDDSYFLGNSTSEVILQTDILYGQIGGSVIHLDGTRVAERKNSFKFSVTPNAQNLVNKTLELTSTLQDLPPNNNILGIKVMLRGGAFPRIWSPADIEVKDGGIVTFYFRIKLFK